jgi:phosphomannomutase
VTPLPVVRYLARSHRQEKGGVHTRKSPFESSYVDLKFFDDNGLNLPMALERSIELLFFREDFVRADNEETGEISFPVGGFDTYVDGFLKAIDVNAVKKRIDTGGEKIFLVDEKGDILPDWVALQIYCYLSCRRNRAGNVGVPVTASRNVEKIAGRFGMGVFRARTLPRSLMETAALEGVSFVGDDSGGYIFPEFQPAFDGMFAIVRFMELLAAEDRSLSDILREIPPTVMLRKKIPCAWEHKGALMRVLTDHARGKRSQFIDGVKIFHGEDWALIYPSQDEAYFHLCVEAEDARDAEGIARSYADLFSSWARKL